MASLVPAVEKWNHQAQKILRRSHRHPWDPSHGRAASGTGEFPRKSTGVSTLSVSRTSASAGAHCAHRVRAGAVAG